MLRIALQAGLKIELSVYESKYEKSIPTAESPNTGFTCSNALIQGRSARFEDAEALHAL